jgi:hypothetical protein
MLNIGCQVIFAPLSVKCDPLFSDILEAANNVVTLVTKRGNRRTDEQTNKGCSQIGFRNETSCFWYPKNIGLSAREPLLFVLGV